VEMRHLEMLFSTLGKSWRAEGGDGDGEGKCWRRTDGDGDGKSWRPLLPVKVGDKKLEKKLTRFNQCNQPFI